MVMSNDRGAPVFRAEIMNDMLKIGINAVSRAEMMIALRCIREPEQISSDDQNGPCTAT